MCVCDWKDKLWNTSTKWYKKYENKKYKDQRNKKRNKRERNKVLVLRPYPAMKEEERRK